MSVHSCRPADVDVAPAAPTTHTDLKEPVPSVSLTASPKPVVLALAFASLRQVTAKGGADVVPGLVFQKTSEVVPGLVFQKTSAAER